MALLCSVTGLCNCDVGFRWIFLSVRFSLAFPCLPFRFCLGADHSVATTAVWASALAPRVQPVSAASASGVAARRFVSLISFSLSHPFPFVLHTDDCLGSTASRVHRRVLLHQQQGQQRQRQRQCGALSHQPCVHRRVPGHHQDRHGRDCLLLHHNEHPHCLRHVCDIFPFGFPYRREFYYLSPSVMKVQCL